MTATNTTARRRFVSPAEEQLRRAKHHDRVTAILATQYRWRTGAQLNEMTRRALRHDGPKCAAVRPWADVPTDYRTRTEAGAHLVMVPGALVQWIGPEAWAEAEREAATPRTRQAWLSYGLRTRRGATSTEGTDNTGKRVQLYAVEATETGEPLAGW